MRFFIILVLIKFAHGAWTDYPGCGYSDVSDAGAERTRIVGGWETVQHEYPYQTSLKTASGDFFCGGSIIDDQRVLTAAHCTIGMTSSMIRVGLGEHTLSSGSQYRLATVSNIRNHEFYNPFSQSYDISVLTLNNDIDINYARRPICPSERQQNHADSYADQRLIVSGWGTTTEGGETSDQLRAVSLYGMTLADCIFGSLYPIGSITDTMMCAGVIQGGKDACQGDSGGPLVYKRNSGQFEQVGVVSWGNGCARIGYPGVYSDAVYFRDWI